MDSSGQVLHGPDDKHKPTNAEYWLFQPSTLNSKQQYSVWAGVEVVALKSLEVVNAHRIG